MERRITTFFTFIDCAASSSSGHVFASLLKSARLQVSCLRKAWAMKNSNHANNLDKQSGTKHPPLALCVAMIARNAAAMVHDTLQSVRELASEIVVLNTGSTDTTAEAAAVLNGVINYQWEDNFAAACNAVAAYSLALLCGSMRARLCRPTKGNCCGNSSKTMPMTVTLTICESLLRRPLARSVATSCATALAFQSTWPDFPWSSSRVAATFHVGV